MLGRHALQHVYVCMYGVGAVLYNSFYTPCPRSEGVCLRPSPVCPHHTSLQLSLPSPTLWAVELPVHVISAVPLHMCPAFFSGCPGIEISRSAAATQYMYTCILYHNGTLVTVFESITVHHHLGVHQRWN